MVSSPAVSRRFRSWALVALLVTAAGPAPALEEAADEPEVVVASGVGRLAGPGPDEAPLRWIETARGVRVDLHPLVARLGGHLEPGTLGASQLLTVGGVEFVLAPGSAALTHGTEIEALSLPPLERDGSMFVPVDFVERTWGAIAGVTWSWDPAERRLAVARPSARELPVEVSLVHVRGVTTVVLRLAEPVRYRIERTETAIEIVPVVDRFLPAPARTEGADPFVRSVSVDSARARLELRTGVEADDYALEDPFRIVIDLYRPQEEQALAEPVAPVGPPQRSRGIHTVVLDPGHGGDETGAIGPGGTMEKELTLAIARTLAERLRAELGLEVVLTRNDDVTLGLDERSALANQRKADLFLSIHLNSTSRGRAKGAETYFLSLAASDERAAELAAVENLSGSGAAPGSDEFDLQLLLWDLAQSRHLAASQRLATIIQEELNRQLEMRDRGVKQAPFRVLTGAAMPAVLVELGFVSNRDEEDLLRDPGYRGELASTLVRAVARFKAENEPGAAASGDRP